VCYITLYFDLLKKFVDWSGNLHYSKLLKKKEKEAPAAVSKEAAGEAAPAEQPEEEKEKEKEKRAKLRIVTDEKDDN
jgi:hypothetical protein